MALQADESHTLYSLNITFQETLASSQLTRKPL